MCGVARDTSGESDIVPPLEAAMPPSITAGSDPPKPAAGPGEHLGQQEPSAATRDITIDLSCDENGDLQKAIALSLQEQQSSSSLQGVSAEDQEVSRALEASLKDSQPQATIDLHNPWERRRQPSIPVGLKNIGNSCWFNGVIQPLFHIPAFRDLILNFPQNVEVEEEMEEPEKCLRHLVPVLRKLFALMIGSKRKYIDPTPAVHMFQGQEMRKNAQQDVCEFIHKLLEKLEEEFHQLLRCQGVEKESSGCHVSKDADFDNPIMKLFYGQSKKEISNGDGDEGLKQEAFGQNILHIMNYEHIHDSILASLASSMPATHGEVVEPVKQEIWFKMLPPVLIYSLSRYEFSHEKKRAEKVHNKFEFPEFLYMDRYMDVNKKVIREKHIKVAKLRGELNSLTKTLDRYLKYGTGEAKYPISDILRYTLEFAQTGLNASSELEADGVPSPSMMEVDGVEVAENDVEMTDAADVKKEVGENPGEKESKTQVNQQVVSSDNHTKGKSMKGGDMERMEEEMTAESPAEEEKAKAREVEPQQMSSPTKKMRILPPAPRNITTSELPILQSCLSRWLQDINTQVAQLRQCISEIEQQLDKMYDEPFLKRIPYHLHAVVVHQGQASGGHYWVYTFDKTRNVWMKFNDIQVVESNWDDLLQDSLGGQNNASAYCLFYVDESRYNSLFPVVPKSTEALMDSLAIDLQEYVKNDNLAFDRELEEWNVKQQGAGEQGKEVAVWQGQETDAGGCNKKTVPTVPSTAPNSPDIILQDSEEAGFFTEIHTILSTTIQEDLTNKDENELQKDQGLLGILRREFVRLRSFANTAADDKYSEPSILDFGVYLIRNNANEDILLRWYGCVVALQVVQTMSGRTPIIDQVALEASRHLQQLQSLHDYNSEYLGWFKHYRNFIECAWSLVRGFKEYEKGQYERALPHLLQACRIHQELKDRTPDGPRKTLDKQVLWKCRETCLLKLNKKLVDTFKDGDEDQIGEIPGHIKSLVVPALTQLSGGWDEDMATVEQVRNHWCNLLDSTSSSAKSEMLRQIIPIVFGENKGSIPQRISQPPAVLALYELYKETCCMVMASTSKTRAQTSEL